MYDIRQVYQPKDLGEALSLLAEHPDAIVISGGTDVLIKVRERKWKDCSLLSIHRLPQLQGVRREKEELVVGPGTCFDQLHETGVIREHAFCLWQAADQVGSPQIRTVATLGGNICNAGTHRYQPNQAATGYRCVLYWSRTHGLGPKKGTADGGADSYNPAGMRQLLHQVWKAQCPGDFHFGLRGVCGARCGEKDLSGSADRFWCGGASSHALSGSGSSGERTACGPTYTAPAWRCSRAGIVPKR